MTQHRPRYTGALAAVELASDALVMGQIITGIESAIELVNRSLDALDRGDRARAEAWLDRAEHLLPEPGAVPEDHRDGVVQARGSIARMRRIAAGLPVDGPQA